MNTARIPSRFSAIEPLEERIAPALLINGANLLGGVGNPDSGETSVGDNSVQLVKVLSGQALVWFKDGNITGISVGPNTNLDIHGDIFGDIVTNLTAAGRLSDSDNDPLNGEDGGVLLPFSITGVKTTSLTGGQKGGIDHIIAGGSISGIKISGEISGIYAGDGGFRTESRIASSGTIDSFVGIDVNPVTPGIQATFSLLQQNAIFAPSASIHDVTITKAAQLEVFAGSGNPNGTDLSNLAGPAGGSITRLTIDTAFVPPGSPVETASYTLLAGSGASGKSGGSGGSIDYVIEKTSSGPVVFKAGKGGNGGAGAGGAGGSITNLDLLSDSSRYTGIAGAGGDGAPAGAGGRLQSANFANRTPLGGVIVAADFTGDGADDIIVADQGTGQMVLSVNNGDGSSFTQQVQFSQNGSPVVLIDAAGSTPTDAAAVDVNRDGKLDLVVAYKNSDSLGIFLNQGDGVFYNSSNEAFDTINVALGFSPAKIAPSTTGGLIAVSENTSGKGTVHVFSREFGEAGITYNDKGASKPLGLTITDIVLADAIYASFGNGTVSKFTPTFTTTNPFVITDTGVAITGGISDLDVDSSGTRILALSTTGRTLNFFDVPTDSSDLLIQVSTIDFSSTTGKPLVAHFTHDSDPLTADGAAVLFGLTTGAKLETFSAGVDDGDPTTPPAPFALGKTLATTQSLKNFVAAYTSGETSAAALSGSLSQFTYADNFATTQQVSLPFASKTVVASAGNGGNGLDLGKLIGKGGAGGSISGINVDAHEITLTTGAGGNSVTGLAGAGGSISNPASFTTATKTLLTPTLLADVLLKITTSDGGAPSADGKTAGGGAGGSIGTLKMTLSAGDIDLFAGDGGLGRGAAGGAGGSISGLTAITQDGSLRATAGNGGSVGVGLGAGGAGGSITNLNHTLTLEPEIETLEKAYSVSLRSGIGGDSFGGAGGAGGSVSTVTLTLDGSDRTFDNPFTNPPQVNAHVDNTVRISVAAGAAGAGTRGGLGGSIRDLKSSAIFDQVTPSGGIITNFVVMSLTAGPGGAGTAGLGGDGGSVILNTPISGVTSFDPDAPIPLDNPDRVALAVTSGDAGSGSFRGGNGGAVSGLVAQNSKFVDGSSITGTHLESARVHAGNGGAGGTSDGGKGGTISQTLIGVQDGFIDMIAGNGGAGGLTPGSNSAKGGAGGSVISSEFGLVSTFSNFGMLIQAGAGGDGIAAGGLGGGLNTLRFNTPQSTAVPSALLYAGDGGAAKLATGTGGKGGDISGIAQLKDVNSSINLIRAGDGGNNTLGKAGAGGNILNVRTVGFIGRPSDGTKLLGAFDTVNTSSGPQEIEQGLFSGLGGTGQTNGANGAVSNIVARQIAAIAAAMRPDGSFGIASKVSFVKADVIGFDVDADGTYDNAPGTSASPSLVKPVDGSILAAVLQSVTGSRAGFTFSA